MLHTVIRFLLFLFVALIATAVTVSSLSAQSQGAIAGTVANTMTSAPIEGAEIRIVGTALRTTSRSDGRFRIDGVPAGTWTVEARLLGRTAMATSVTVAAGALTQVELKLAIGPISLTDVVVTATRTQRSLLDVPAAVTIVGTEEIAARGANQLGDALVGTPSVRVTDYSDGFSQGIQIRSLGESGHYQNAEVLVLVDGIPQLNANSQSFLDQVPFEQVERIEVVGGPSSALYGRNAIAGTVNIITRRPPSAPSLTAEIGAGSFGSWNPRLSGGGSINDRVSFLVAGSLERMDGWRDRTDRRAEDVLGKITLDLGAGSNLSLTGQYLNLRHRLATQIPFRPDGTALPVDHSANFNVVPNHDTSNEMSQVGLNFDHHLGSAVDVSLVAYLRNTHRLLEGDGSFIDAIDEDHNLLIIYPFDAGLEERILGAEARLVWRTGILGLPQEITVGFSYEHSSGTSPGATIAPEGIGAFGEVTVNYLTGEANVNDLQRYPMRDGHFEVDNLGAYIQSELHVTNRTSITAGLRWDRQERSLVDELRESNREGSYSRVTPKIALNHAWSASASTYVSYAEGFNPPFGAAFQFDRDGVEDLKPERAHNFEIGVKAELFDRRLLLSTAAFHLKRRDLVQTVREDNRNVQVNAGALDVNGMEFDARAWLDGVVPGLSVHGNYAHSDPVWKDYVLGETNFAGQVPVNVSRHVASAGLAWHGIGGWITLGAWGDYVSGWFMDRANTVESDPLAVFNARVGVSPPIAPGMSLRLRVLNLLNKEYYTRSELDFSGNVIAASVARPRAAEVVVSYGW